MRKIVIVLFLCIAVSGIIKNQTSHKKEISTLLLHNVEALAADEVKNYYCVSEGSVDCPIAKVKVEYVFGGYSLE